MGFLDMVSVFKESFLYTEQTITTKLALDNIGGISWEKTTSEVQHIFI